jgi:hypothetical protein
VSFGKKKGNVEGIVGKERKLLSSRPDTTNLFLLSIPHGLADQRGREAEERLWIPFQLWSLPAATTRADRNHGTWFQPRRSLAHHKSYTYLNSERRFMRFSRRTFCVHRALESAADVRDRAFWLFATANLASLVGQLVYSPQPFHGSSVPITPRQAHTTSRSYISTLAYHRTIEPQCSFRRT